MPRQAWEDPPSQIVDSGAAKQVEIVKAFGVSIISVKRYVKILREKGPGGFFDKKHWPI